MEKIKGEKFHFIPITCPDCGTKAAITDIYFSTQGSIRFRVVCVECKKEMILMTSWAQLMMYCIKQESTKGENVIEGVKTIQ